MLHQATLARGTLELLNSLCAHPDIKPFALAGGTALALRFGHRLSVDLDFFTPSPFDTGNLAHTLASTHSLVPTDVNANGLSGTIEGVKVDFVTYRYPILDPFEVIDGVRLFGLRDNIGMKLSALVNR